MSSGLPQIENSAAPVAWRANQLVTGPIIRDGLSGPTSDSLPTCSDMQSTLGTLGGGGYSVSFAIHNLSASDLTITPGDADTTISGTAVVSAGTSRTFYASGDASAMTVQSLFSQSGISS